MPSNSADLRKRASLKSHGHFFLAPKLEARHMAIVSRGTPPESAIWYCTRTPPPPCAGWPAPPPKRDPHEIGRASCRERVCQYVLISVVGVSLNKTMRNKC